MKANPPSVFGVLLALLLGIISVPAQSPFAIPPHRAQTPQAKHASVPPSPPHRRFGDPLPGLTPAQLAAFARGREEFEDAETVATGLGPIFNNVSCVACHSAPVTGGGSAIVVTRFGRTVNGVFHPLRDKGGSLLQQFAIDPAVREVVPPEANTIAHRRTTPLFGLGLIEAIPDDTIRQHARIHQPDGITGCVAEVKDITTGRRRIGRFGWKAQHATLLAFSADAYLNEMGITSRFFPHENAPNGKAALLALFGPPQGPEDEVDPATGRSDIDALADFMRVLAPPPRLPLTASARAGEALFTQTGCAHCHTPVMYTGASPIRALHRQPVALYSDLLLHDMRTLGDGIAQGAAGPHEMRTPPLWGVRASAPYLHDGRAATLHDAIAAHRGEARIVRDRYLRLSPTQRRQLLDFLHCL